MWVVGVDELFPSLRALDISLLFCLAGISWLVNSYHGFYTRYRITDSTFGRLRDELVNAGFIKVVQNNKTVRKANVYQFSNAWKMHEGKRDKIIHYDFSALSQ